MRYNFTVIYLHIFLRNYSWKRVSEIMDLYTLTLFIAIFILSWFYFYNRRQSGLPPGPRGLPIIGHLHLLEKNRKAFEQISEWRKQFGDIFTVYFGSHPVIYLCNQRLINEVFVKRSDVTSDRPSWFFFNNVVGRDAGEGIMWSHAWTKTRKFSQKALKGFGVGKSSNESLILIEVSALIGHLDKDLGQPIRLGQFMHMAVSNIICSIVLGTRYSYDDQFFIDLLHKTSVNFSADLICSTINCVPCLVPFCLLFQKKFLSEVRDNAEFFTSWVQDKINEHEESFDADNIRDFVDLQILMSRTGNSKYGSITASDVKRMIWELFMAGSETTSSLLRWIILYMMAFPEVKAKCQEEIHKVIGPSRLPKMADEGSLVYTEATLLEVHRICSLGNTTLPHCATKTFTVDGFTIPKDAMITASMNDLHHDVTVWGDPEEFRPERWIDVEGKLMKNNEHYMPFGIGRRICLGEKLARMQIFLFGVSLIQQFNFLPVDPDKPPSLERFHRLSLVPEDFDVIVTRL